MTVKSSSAYGSNNLNFERKNFSLNDPLEPQIENAILDFINNPPHIPKRRFIIAHNQMLSLYRRMNFYPEKKVLFEFYKNKIIQLEKGKEK